MALTNCPECGNQVSTAANSCPHCGFVPQNQPQPPQYPQAQQYPQAPQQQYGAPHSQQYGPGSQQYPHPRGAPATPKGLSRNAKIGIGVGAFVVLAAIAGGNKDKDGSSDSTAAAASASANPSANDDFWDVGETIKVAKCEYTLVNAFISQKEEKGWDEWIAVKAVHSDELSASCSLELFMMTGESNRKLGSDVALASGLKGADLCITEGISDIQPIDSISVQVELHPESARDEGIMKGAARQSALQKRVTVKARKLSPDAYNKLSGGVMGVGCKPEEEWMKNPEFAAAAGKKPVAAPSSSASAAPAPSASADAK